MGHVKKDKTRDYWSISKLNETLIFGKLMSTNGFEKICNSWHYSDNSILDDEADRVYKIRLVLGILVKKFRKHYKPPQELYLDEEMIPWRGPLRIRTYNPGKLVKYGILVHTVCEATTGYIGNMKIYTAEGKKLKETTFSLLEPYLHLWHHVYQDNYCNSIEIAEAIPKKEKSLPKGSQSHWLTPLKAFS
jgi:hypothetical protein